MLCKRGDAEIQKEGKLKHFAPTSNVLVLNLKSTICFGFRELCVQAHSWRHGAAVMVTSNGKGEYNDLKNPTKPTPYKIPLGLKASASFFPFSKLLYKLCTQMKELQKGILLDFKYQQDLFGCDIASYGSSEIFFIIFQVYVLKLCLF